MKKIVLPILAVAAVATLMAKAPKDPVVMTVDGQPVGLSEYEYIFHKNDDQQLDKETPEQFLQRFIDYKLKVAAARHAQVDTTAAVKQEYRKYRSELAQPYLRDTTALEPLYEQQWERMQTEVEFDHMMFASRAKADSIRALALAGEDFIELAKKYSEDPSLQRNEGHYGWHRTGSFPYDFEEIVWNTPIGGVSDIITTDFGYHFVKVLNRRDAQGDIHGAHILGNSRELMDSIYQALQGGADFEELARKYGTDGTAPKGGDLGWFGHGAMVPEFESQIYALKDGEVSRPFQSRFGIHIAKRIATRDMDKENAMKLIKRQVSRDERAQVPMRARAAQLRKEYKARIVPEGQKAIMDAIAAKGYAASLDELKSNETPLFQVGDSTVTIAQYLQRGMNFSQHKDTLSQVEGKLADHLDHVTLVYESNRLGQKYPEFRNVDREYHDGLMLFAISEEEIWNKPKNDPEGLKAYFEANRTKYIFPTPRWKGYIIYATTDSLAHAIVDYLYEVKPADDDLYTVVKEKFPKDNRIQRVVLPEKNDQVVDYVAFGGPEPKFSERQTMKHFDTYGGHLITVPEEVGDVRNSVSADWIDELEQEWVARLRQTYPVKVNEKVLKKVK